MLGDIVSNSTKPNATAAKPVRPVTEGYGATNFGDMRRPNASRPVAAAPKAAPAAQRQTTVASSVAAAPAVSRPVAVPCLASSKKRGSSKVPLILTIVGVVVFIGGVAGLFAYALGGK